MTDIINMDGEFGYNELSFARVWEKMGATTSTDDDPEEIDIDYIASQKNMAAMLSVCEDLIQTLLDEEITPSDRQDLAILLLTKMREIEHPPEKDNILITGTRNDVIHILEKGKAHVMSRDDSVEIRTLFAPDYFGEISAMYGVPCTNPVTLSGGSVLHGLSAREVKLAFKPRKLASVQNVFMRRRYIPTGALGFNSTSFIKAVVHKTLEKTVLFKNWSDSGLWTLVESFPEHPIIVYPSGAHLLTTGDVRGQMMLLIVGRADLYWRSGVVSVEAKSDPVVIGEENLVFPDKEHTLTVTATSPCHVIHITAELLDDVITKLQLENNTSVKAWEDSVNAWNDVEASRSDGENFPENRVEIMSEKLKQVDAFSRCSVQCLYYIAMFVVAKCITDGQIIMSTVKKKRPTIEESSIIVLLDGEAETVTSGTSGAPKLPSKVKKDIQKKTASSSGTEKTNDSDMFFIYFPNAAIYYQDWMIDTSLEVRARGTARVVAFSLPVLQQAVKMFPESKFFFKPSSSLLTEALKVS